MRTWALQLTAKECEAVAVLAPHSRVTAARDGCRTRLKTIEQLEASIARVVDARDGWVFAKDLRIFVGYIDPSVSAGAREALMLLQMRVQALPPQAGIPSRRHSAFRSTSTPYVTHTDAPAA